MPKYIKAHPFGYKPNKQSPKKHKFTPIGWVQTITIKVPYEITMRDSTGKIMLNEDNKPIKQIFFNTVQKTIKHVKPENRKGKTLAEMVYESVYNHYNKDN